MSTGAPIFSYPPGGSVGPVLKVLPNGSSPPAPRVQAVGGWIPEFEGLRGLLSWWVVLDHVFLACGRSVEDLPQFVRLLAHGDYAVDLFIILSGYVIFKLLSEGGESYGRFLARRVCRLMPVFLVCLAGAVLLQPLLLGNLLGSSWGEQPVMQRCLANWRVDQAHAVPHVLAHLTLLHGAVPEAWLPGAAVAFLGAAWSISLEWQFYLVAPAVRWWLGRAAVAGAGVLICGVIVAQWRFGTVLDAAFPMHSFLLQKFWLFWIGIGSYVAARRLTDLGSDHGLGRLLLGWACPIVLLTTLSVPLAVWTAVWGVTLTARDERSRVVRGFRRVLNAGVVQWLGRVSYSTYLGHALCLWCAHAVILGLAPGIGAWACFAWLLPVTAGLTLAFSAGLHRYVERPGVALGRRLGATGGGGVAR